MKQVWEGGVHFSDKGGGEVGDSDGPGRAAEAAAKVRAQGMSALWGSRCSSGGLRKAGGSSVGPRIRREK